jgi:predicted nucleotidyltransferase
MGKRQLNELRYNASEFSNLKDGDILVVFKGNVNIFDSNDKSQQAVQKLTALLSDLCEMFYTMYDTIFNNYGRLRDIFTKENNKNLYETLYNFIECPKVIIGDIIEEEGIVLSLYGCSSYDVENSKELYDLLYNTNIMNFISSIEIDEHPFNPQGMQKQNDVPIANPLYHGTITKYLPSILTKGLRKIQENSMFTANNEGFVFLTSDFNIAKDYAEMYKRKFGTQAAILEINSNNIDKNKMVLDYDFEQSFVGIGNKSAYSGEDISYSKFNHFKGNILKKNNDSYGTQFAKIGYKGMIMPNAITKCHVFDGRKNKATTYTKEEYLQAVNNNDNMEDVKNESINRINEVNSSQLSLQSFDIQESLHPKMWIEEKDGEYRLNSKVRLRLLDIADDFIDGLSVSWIKPKDIIFTGSLANYNWSKYSDIDIHILYDFKKIYKNSDFVDDYFKAKKEVWLKNHKQLKVYGYPIEISVEDCNEKNPSSGRYSLEQNKWITEPTDFQDATLNKNYIKDYSAKVMTEIDKLEKSIKSETDRHKIEVMANKVEKIFTKLKNLRSEGLESKKKEMSSGNVIYKLVRRMKYIDKIWSLVNYAYDKVNTITEKKSRY